MFAFSNKKGYKPFFNPARQKGLNDTMAKEGNVIFNDTFDTFYLQLYSVGHVKDHSDSERGNPLPPLHGLLFLHSSKGCFICIIPQTE